MANVIYIYIYIYTLYIYIYIYYLEACFSTRKRCVCTSGIGWYMIGGHTYIHTYIHAYMHTYKHAHRDDLKNIVPDNVWETLSVYPRGGWASDRPNRIERLSKCEKTVHGMSLSDSFVISQVCVYVCVCVCVCMCMYV